MTQPTFDFTALFDTYRQAFAPVIAAQQGGLKTLERLVRHQYAVAGERPVTSMFWLEPEGCGAGAPLADDADAKFAPLMGTVE